MNSNSPGLPNSGAAASNSPLVQQIEEAERMRQAGDPQGALQRIDRIVRAHPSNVRALNEMGVCLRLVGHPVKAALELRKARKLAPNSPELLANLGDCLRDEQDYEKALRAYEKAVELRPDFAQVYCEIAATQQALHRPKKAIRAYEKGLAIKPAQPGPMANFASACLEDGQIEKALELSDQSLALMPQGRRAMAVKGFALHELGRESEAAELFNLDLVRPFTFEGVEGFENIEAFNKALATHVSQHSTLEYEPANRSTTKGEQTAELFSEPLGPIAQLQELIEASVRTFLDDLPRQPDHPYLSLFPSKFNWNLWGTRLASSGHQAPHIHPSAWVSGVYYAQVPNEVLRTGDNHDGWIEFGKAPDQCKLERPRPLRRIAPVEGTLVLFPSYYYHRTLPFQSKRRRISIAFDAIPIG